MAVNSRIRQLGTLSLRCVACLALGPALLSMAGCESKEKSPRATLGEQPGLMSPIHLGMSREAVLNDDSLKVTDKNIAFLVQPSQLQEGWHVRASDGVELGIAFKDDRVRYIRCDDERRRVGTIGVGSRYDEVSREYPDASMMDPVSMGCYVETEPGIWLVFASSCPPSLEDTVWCIEVRGDF